MQSKIQSKVFWRIFLAFAVGVFALGGFAEAQVKSAKNRKTKQTKQVNKMTADKIEYQPNADLLKKMQAQISVVESKKDWARFNRQSPIVNKSGTRSAYIAQFAIDADKENLIDVIVVNDSAANKFYEIRGFDFPRPFDRLKWIGEDTLEFEQWVNPSNGGRYQVNIQTGKVIAAGYVRSN